MSPSIDISHLLYVKGLSSHHILSTSTFSPLSPTSPFSPLKPDDPCKSPLLNHSGFTMQRQDGVFHPNPPTSVHVEKNKHHAYRHWSCAL